MKKQTRILITMASKTKEEMANEMQIDISTLRRKLKKANIEVPRGYITPDIQKVIYEALGYKVFVDNQFDDKK